MTTQAIDTTYGSTAQQAAKARQEAEAALKAQAQQYSTSSTSQTSSMSQVREQIESLLANIPRSNGDKLTFKDLADYKETLEKEWSEQFEADMTKLGVDTSIDIKLSVDSSTGVVTAQKGHPDKAAIDKYFLDNPEMAEKFEEGVQLSKLTSTAERNLTPSELRQSLTAQSMSIWFESNSSASSLLMGGGMVLNQAGAAYASLDLRV